MATVCTTHDVDGVHPISVDCPICMLTKQVETLLGENLNLQERLAGYEATKAAEVPAKKETK